MSAYRRIHWDTVWAGTPNQAPTPPVPTYSTGLTFSLSLMSTTVSATGCYEQVNQSLVAAPGSPVGSMQRGHVTGDVTTGYRPQNRCAGLHRASPAALVKRPAVRGWLSTGVFPADQIAIPRRRISFAIRGLRTSASSRGT